MQTEHLEQFHAEVMAGCDIQKGRQGLYRQVRVVVGLGLTVTELQRNEMLAALQEIAAMSCNHGPQEYCHREVARDAIRRAESYAPAAYTPE